MRSYSNSKLHTKGIPSRMLLDFGDPLDSTIIQKNALQWSYRAYIEAKECFKKNGFVLFDTLTYDDCELKYYHDLYPKMICQCWDYPCFCRADIQKFMKRLRKRLHYLAFDVEHNFRYLITSEYGSTKGCTHRPHYHLLFFVTFDIDPVFLSSLISSCWCSITDGYPDKSKIYVRNERVFRGIDGKALNVFNYVCKYITKDLYTYAKLSRRAYMAFTLTHPNWLNSPKWRKEFKRFKSQVMNFHLQSLGFGAAALNDEKSIKRGFFMFKTPKQVLKVELGTYYERKAYMHLEHIGLNLVWRRNRTKDAFDYFWIKSQRQCRELSYNLQQRFCFDLKKSFDIAQYHVYKRGLFLPKYMIDDAPKSIFEMLYFSELPKEMRCYYHKRISFEDIHFFRASGAFISNQMLRDVFKYTYKSNKNNIITSRNTDPTLLRPVGKRPERHLLTCCPVGLRPARHFMQSARIAVHDKAGVSRPVCYGNLLNKQKVLSLEELLQVGIDDMIVCKNPEYDKYLDTYFDELNESRSLRSLDEYYNSRLRYRYKVMQAV